MLVSLQKASCEEDATSTAAPDATAQDKQKAGSWKKRFLQLIICAWSLQQEATTSAAAPADLPKEHASGQVQQLAEEPARVESFVAKEDAASTTGLVSASAPTAHEHTKEDMTPSSMPAPTASTDEKAKAAKGDNKAKDATPVSTQKARTATASTAAAGARTDKKAPEPAEPGKKDTKATTAASKEDVPGKESKASERKSSRTKHRPRLFDLGLSSALGLDPSDASADLSEALQAECPAGPGGPGPGKKRSPGRLRKLGLAALVEPGLEEGTLTQPSATQEEQDKDSHKRKESQEEKQRPKRLQSLGLAKALRPLEALEAPEAPEGDQPPDPVHPGSQKDTEDKALEELQAKVKARANLAQEVPIPKANDAAKLDAKHAAAASAAKVAVWKNKGDEARAAGQAAAAAALEDGKDAMQASSTGTAELLRVGRERGLASTRLVNLAAELAGIVVRDTSRTKPASEEANFRTQQAAAKAAESTGAPPPVQATKGAIAAADSVMEAWTRNPDGLTEEILNTVAQVATATAKTLGAPSEKASRETARVVACAAAQLARAHGKSDVQAAVEAGEAAVAVAVAQGLPSEEAFEISATAAGRTMGRACLRWQKPEKAADEAGDATAAFADRVGMSQQRAAEMAAAAAGETMTSALLDDDCSLKEVALRAGREAARSAEEWGLVRHRAWEAGAAVAARALGGEASASGKPLDSIVLEATEVVKFIGNGGNPESVKQAARGLGRYFFEVELELGKLAPEVAAHAARFGAAAAKGRMSRQKVGRLACSLAAELMRKEASTELLSIQDAAFKAGLEAGLENSKALELSTVEAGIAAGLGHRFSSGACAPSEAGKCAHEMASKKNLPSSLNAKVAAKAAARCAVESPNCRSRFDAAAEAAQAAFEAAQAAGAAEAAAAELAALCAAGAVAEAGLGLGLDAERIAEEAGNEAFRTAASHGLACAPQVAAQAACLAAQDAMDSEHSPDLAIAAAGRAARSAAAAAGLEVKDAAETAAVAAGKVASDLEIDAGAKLEDAAAAGARAAARAGSAAGLAPAEAGRAAALAAGLVVAENWIGEEASEEAALVTWRVGVAQGLMHSAALETASTVAAKIAGAASTARGRCESPAAPVAAAAARARIAFESLVQKGRAPEAALEAAGREAAEGTEALEACGKAIAMTLGRLLLAASDGKRSPEEQASKAGAAGVKAGIAAGLLPGPAVDAGIGIAAHLLTKKRPDEDLASRAVSLAHLAQSLGLSAGLRPDQAAERAATAVATRATCAAMTAYEDGATAMHQACDAGLQAGDAVGLTPARNAEVTSLAVTWAVLDTTLTASTNTEDVLQVAEQVVQQIGELGDTSTERLQQCAVKTAAHAAACARLLQGAAPQAAASAAAAALKVGQKHKLPFNDVQCLAVAAAGRAATLDAMASCCSSEQAVRQAAAAASRAAVDVGLPREKALECQALHAGGAAAHLATAAGKALDEAAAVAGHAVLSMALGAGTNAGMAATAAVAMVARYALEQGLTLKTASIEEASAAAGRAAVAAGRLAGMFPQVAGEVALITVARVVGQEGLDKRLNLEEAVDEAAKAAKMAWLGAHLVPDRASYHASISAGMFWGRALLTKGASLNETAASAGQAAAAAALDFGLAISQVAKCAALAAGALAAEASFAAAKPPDVVATTAAAHAIAAAESQGMNRKAAAEAAALAAGAAAAAGTLAKGQSPDAAAQFAGEAAECFLESHGFGKQADAFRGKAALLKKASREQRRLRLHCSPHEAAKQASAAAMAFGGARGAEASVAARAARSLLEEYPTGGLSSRPQLPMAAPQAPLEAGVVRAVEAAPAEDDEPSLAGSPLEPRRKSKGGDRQDGQQARDGSDDPEAHRPAWQRNLIKEFEEVDAIEAAAIRIRRDLQNLNEETERADVDAEAAALMLDLRGSTATGRRSSTAELHGDVLPELSSDIPLEGSSCSAAASTSHGASEPERLWHLEVLRLRRSLDQMAKGELPRSASLPAQELHALHGSIILRRTKVEMLPRRRVLLELGPSAPTASSTAREEPVEQAWHRLAKAKKASVADYLSCWLQTSGSSSSPTAWPCSMAWRSRAVHPVFPHRRQQPDGTEIKVTSNVREL
eukprot:s2905_g1.t4